MGYKKVTLDANKKDIIGQIFVSKDTSIQDIMVDGNFNQEGGDWIMCWDPTSRAYTTAFFWGEDLDGVFDPSDSEYENPLGAGWGDGEQFIIDGVIPAGKAFWTQAYEGGALLLSGEVTNDGTVSLDANRKNLICNPFPVDTDIQEIIPGGNFNQEGGDWIMWWNSSTRSYTTAFFWGEDIDGVFDPTDVDYENPLGAGWGDGNQFKVDGIIPAGHGFWAQAYDGGTLTFTNPVSAE